MISIHAPRGGSDQDIAAVEERLNDFNPRSPWGERHPGMHSFSCEFQSTLPVGGATEIIKCLAEYIEISIHAPRGGSDETGEVRTIHIMHFNPRSPWGERLQVASPQLYKL